MKLKFNFRSILCLLVLGSMVTFSSCNRKKADPEVDENTQEQASARDNSQTESDSDASTDMENRALGSISVMPRGINNEQLESVPFLAGGSCAEISAVNSGTNRIVTIDFGATGCAGVDGRTRKGKVILTFSVAGTTGWFNPFNVVGSSITTTFDNHYVGFAPNLVKIEGTRRVICQAITNPTPNQPTLTAMRKDSIIATNLTATFPDNTTHVWNSNRSRTFTASNFEWANNLNSRRLEVWGTYSGKNRNNVNYTGSAPSTNKVVWKGSCPSSVYRPVAGILTLTRTLNNVTRTALVNYGNESCDNTFTVTVNGQTYTID